MNELKEAIERKEGPCVILAGAGTGKTYAIVEKIKYLIENKAYEPKRIVCITFSNEAANNLLLRVQKNLHLPVGEEPTIRTFHAFSAEILRKHGDKIGIIKEFKILDPDQAMVILHRNLRVHVNYCQKYINTIGTAKDLGIRLEDFKEFIERKMKEYGDIDFQKRIESLNFELATIHLRQDSNKKKFLVEEIKNLRRVLEMKKFVLAWNAYEKMKVKGNYQDYSDLSANALLLLQRFPDISQDYSYIIVDEFQDTNKLQLDFLVKLTPHRNITIVGDMNQSIYRFRGAYSKNLQLFKKYFDVSDNDVFTLSRSYRSPNSVLRVAHQLISRNYSSPDECFFVENAHKREGEKVEVFQLKNAQEETRKVIELVQREKENGTPLEEICVIFRTHQYGRMIKRSLEYAGIPYYAVSRASLLKQKSVKAIYDYLVILDKLKKETGGGEQTWWDLLYLMNFSGEDLVVLGKNIQKLSKKNRRAGEESKKPSESEIVHVFSPAFVEVLKKVKLSEAGMLSLRVLLEKIHLMMPLLDKPLSEALQEMYKISGLLNEQRTFEEKEVMMNLQKFYDVAKTHEELYDSDVSNFLYYLEVLQNLGIEIEAAKLEETGVRLMTCHSTKGLEYSTVILTNFAQGRFPIERYIGNSLIPTELLPEVREELKSIAGDEKEDFVINYEKHHQLLEERRLAYVSFTRAKERLILTFAEEYTGKKSVPSVFLDEFAYLKNPDVSFVKDSAQLYHEPEPEIKTGSTFAQALDSQNFENVLNTIAAESGQEREKEKIQRLSPSALFLFDECQKEFEYKYIYRMPERKKFSWESMQMGSFVHLVLEKGVASRLQKVEDFLLLARQLSLNEEWSGVEWGEADTLIRVFFERNKGKYGGSTKTEQYLLLTLGEVQFMGFADRIDFFPDGSISIVDYKTGKTPISKKDRDWQLGFYALAALERYGRVRKVVLDMLKQERPLEFEFDEQGNAKCISSKWIDGFNLDDVRKQLIDASQAIMRAYNEGFKACSLEKNCEFCNEYVYGM